MILKGRREHVNKSDSGVQISSGGIKATHVSSSSQNTVDRERL